MSDHGDIDRAGREAAERSSREQGLPAKITDAAVLEKVAAIVKDDEKKGEAA